MCFSSQICEWYQHNKRDLPWRYTTQAYPIWLSEVMLQQTRVNQALPYFTKFLKRFPKVCDLANATEEEVLKMWQGLGYYSRGRNLHKAAKRICFEFQGEFPRTFENIKKLPGVGDYTASAIASFAFQIPVAVVDGNVYRVLSRFSGISTPINSPEGEKKFKNKAEELLSKKNPALHNQAIMEFGALHCTPKKPNCLFCPLQEKCVAFQLNKVHELPVKLKKTKVKNLYQHYFIFETTKQKTLVKQRNFNGIWKNLFVFPVLEYLQKPTLEEVKNDFENNFGLTSQIKRFEKKPKQHMLSHRKIQAYFWSVKVTDFELEKIKKQNKYHLTSFQEINKFAVPVLIQNFIEAFISDD